MICQHPPYKFEAVHAEGFAAGVKLVLNLAGKTNIEPFATFAFIGSHVFASLSFRIASITLAYVSARARKNLQKFVKNLQTDHNNL